MHDRLRRSEAHLLLREGFGVRLLRHRVHERFELRFRGESEDVVGGEVYTWDREAEIPLEISPVGALLRGGPDAARGAVVPGDDFLEADDAAGAADFHPEGLLRRGFEPAVAGRFAPDVTDCNIGSLPEEKGERVGVGDGADGEEGGVVGEVGGEGDFERGAGRAFGVVGGAGVGEGGVGAGV